MLTLVKYEISKRVKFSLGIILGLILVNTLFTGIVEIYINRSNNLYEGYDNAFAFSIICISILHVMDIKNNFYQDRGKMIFSFPLKGQAIVLSRLILLLTDVALTTFLNLFISFLVRLVVIHNFKSPIKFLTETFDVIFHNLIPVIFIIIIMFLFMYFAIALSETLFYQNGIVGLISTIGMFILYAILIWFISYLLNLFIVLKLPTGVPQQEDTMIFIPVIENSYYNITNIFLVAASGAASFIGASKIIDKHLNL